MCYVGVFIANALKKICANVPANTLTGMRHFQWDTNHLFLSQQRAVLQCQPSAISMGISFLSEY